MPKADDFTSGPGRVLEEPLYLNFAVSRPPGGERGPAEGEPVADSPSAENAPLYLDPALRAPRGRRPASPSRSAAGARPERKALAAGLAVVIGLSVAGALWAYSALERHAPPGGEATPASAPAPAPAPTAPPSPSPTTQLATAPAPAEPGPAAGPVVTTTLPAPTVEAPPPPRQALAAAPLAAPEVARPERHAPRPAVRHARRGAGPEALAATARANTDEAATPRSTLSAQSAGEAPPSGD